MTEYEIKVTSDFLIEGIRATNRTKKVQVALKFAFYAVLFCCLIFVAFICFNIKAYVAGVAITMLAATLPLSNSINRWHLRRRHKKSPHAEVINKIRVGEDGLSYDAPTGSGLYNWNSFTHAHLFQDGILLFQGPDLYNWLPASAITSGTHDDALKVVAAHLRIDHRS